MNKKHPRDQKAVSEFSSRADFKLPNGYLEFLSTSNGAEGQLEGSYLILWPIEELFSLNEGYYVDEFAPGFFIIGSDGSGTAFAFDKLTGEFYEMPFIGMSREEAVFRAKDFAGLINSLDEGTAN
ncbi:MAG TPA: SMI1/KNR4 family protein [Chryseolinea sp.]